MTIAHDIIQHVNNFVERQRKQHRRVKRLLKEIDDSNSTIELVQELSVMMCEINTASELYGSAFKSALDALWDEILETKKEAVKIVQREAEEAPVLCAGSHWEKGFPELTEEDIQEKALFLIATNMGIYAIVRAIPSADHKDIVLCCLENKIVWTGGHDSITWHMRVPRPTKDKEK